ncbi:PIG-L family deacetylase [Candidatus Woesearchaeota archaeon]|nr:PIG-L family deacetylase [Candidatus Woesearchaeota archaeon]
MIVAHPDDETIWVGGTLLSNMDNWDVTIISLCRRDDEDRAPRFKKVCRAFKAKCFMSDLEDEKLNDIPVSEAVKRIKQHSEKDYDYIFTHGENGEYGHKRHKDVNKAVTKMLDEKVLSAKKVFFFSYKKEGKLCCANKKSNKFIYLKDIYFKKKKKIIQKLYGFNKNSVEDLYCGNTEAFKIKEAI